MDTVPTKKPYVEIGICVGQGKLSKSSTLYGVVDLKSMKAATASTQEADVTTFINPYLTIARTTKEEGGTLSAFLYKAADGQIKSISRKFNLVGDRNSEFTITVPVFCNTRLMHEDQLLSLSTKDASLHVKNLEKNTSPPEDLEVSAE
jgi:hypothetical protein